MKRLIFGILLVLNLQNLVYSQSFPIENISINQGLPQSVVYDIFQDSNGFIWFATQDGIGRYDGVEFTNISVKQGLLDNMTRSIIETASGEIWVATDNGIAIIKQCDDLSLETYAHPVLNDQPIRAMLPNPDSTVWVGSIMNGLYLVSDSTQIQHWNTDSGLAHNRIFGIKKRGSDLVVGTDGGVSILKDGLFTNFTEKEGLLSERIRTILVDTDGSIWAAGYGNGISILGTKGVEALTTKDGFPPNKVNKLIKQKNGTIIAATDGNGAALIKDRSIKLINSSNGLKNASLQSALEDEEGNIWFGTWGSGSYKIRYLNIRLFTSTNGLSEDNVTAIYVEDNDIIWVGTNNKGLMRIQDGKFTYFTKNNSALPTNRIFNITRFNNQIWIATDRGLLRYERGKIRRQNIHPTLNSVSIRGFAVDETENSIWVGAFNNGAIKYSGDSYKEFSRKDGLINDSVFAITSRKNGEVWLGSDGGISIYKNGEIIRNLTKENGLIDNRISALFEDSKQNIWIGSYKNGLMKLTGDGIEAINVQSGLSNNLVTFITEDADGSIWVGTKNGLNRIRGESIKKYSNKNGLLSNETNQNAVFVKGRSIYIGTVNGLTIMDIDSNFENKYNPPVFVKQISVWDKKVNKAYLQELKSNENFIKFDFTAIHFANPTELSFSYRLLGFDDEWRETSERSVQFTSLHANNYTFQVKALTPDGLLSEESADVSFSIIPPIWDTNFFKFIMLFLIIALIGLGYRYKGSRLQRMNEKLEVLVKNRTADVEKREQLFRLISENAGDMIAVCTAEGLINYASPSWEKLLGYTKADILDKQVFDIIDYHSRKEVMGVVEALRDKREEIKTVEVKMIHKSGESRTFVTTVSFVKGTADIPDQFVIIGHDISSRVEAEHRLKKAKKEAEQANKAKSQFLASMSHELRTPLNAILGFTQIMSHANDLNNRYKDYVNVMHSSGEHLLSMINDILDLSKIEADRMELKPVSSSLRDFLTDLEGIMQVQAHKKNLELQFMIASDLPVYIHSDFNKLRQVLINLIGNAIKYTDKGSVKLEVQRTKNAELIFNVIDTGPGIPEDQLQKIFDAFHQVQLENFSKGTGLGLTISTKIAELMNGTISVQSTLGKGTTFTLQIPFKESGVEVVKVDEEVRYKVYSSDEKPLAYVIDDVDENRMILSEYMKQTGFETREFESAIPALESLNSEKPDIILTDIIMPKMNGKQFLLEARNLDNGRDIPIIAVSASIFAESKEELVEMGFDEFFYKPINMNELISKIREITPIEFEIIENLETVDLNNQSSVDIKSEIKQLEPEFKQEFMDALEMMDMEKLEEMLKDLDNGSNLKKQLKEAISQKNFRLILNLTD